MNKKLSPVVRLLRPAQWVKNGLVFAGLIFSKRLFDVPSVVLSVRAFASFCVVSSIVYIVNDILDRHADRLHPIKRKRPIAAGLLSIPQAAAVAAVLTGLLVLLLEGTGENFAAAIAAYAVLNTAYSLLLKRVLLVDVFVIAAGFMLRVVGGVFVLNVEISSWLVLCTLFMSVFLGISKRRSELILNDSTHRESGRSVLKHYDVDFLDQLMTIAASGMAISYALYTVAQRTVMIFGSEHLIFTTIFVLFGIFRYLYLVRSRKTDDNPAHILLTDPAMLATIAVWFLSCVAIIYVHDLRF